MSDPVSMVFEKSELVFLKSTQINCYIAVYLRQAQGVLYTMVYSLVYSLHARCYNVSLASSI